MQQIITQTQKLEVVQSVYLLDRENGMYRELLLMKLGATKEDRTHILEICNVFHAKIEDLSRESMIISVTGTPEKIDGFLDIMSCYNIVEVCRTGIAGIETPKARNER